MISGLNIFIKYRFK